MRLALSLLLLFTLWNPLSAQEEPTVHKVVIDLKTGDMKAFEGMINGLAKTYDYYQGRLEEFQAAVVIHGEAYRFFLKDPAHSVYKEDKALIQNREALHSRLKNLVEFYGVTFEMCSAGMKSRGIEKEAIYPFVTPIFTALTGLVEWQNRGFAYFPVHK